MLYIDVILVIVALVFAVLNLTLTSAKINLVGWALLLLCIAMLLPRALLLAR